MAGISLEPESFRGCDALCAALSWLVLDRLPGAVHCAVDCERSETLHGTVGMLIAVRFTNGRESRFVYEFDARVVADSKSHENLVAMIFGATERAFADKMSKAEVEEWRGTREQARALCADADAAFASVEKTIG